MKESYQKYFLSRWKLPCIFVMILIVTNLSCFQDPISIDLSEFDQNIVIEGNLSDQPGINSVRISRTIQMNRNENFPPVSGAIVAIKDNLDNSEQLEEVQPGFYKAFTLVGVPERTYTLTVSVDGKKFSAISTMPKPLRVHEVNVSTIAPGTAIFYARCKIRDRSGFEDYFQLNIYKNGILEDNYLHEDGMEEGKENVIDDFNVQFYVHDVITAELITLNEINYEFLRTLEEINERDAEAVIDTIMPLTTINPTTNLDNGALGYFSTHTIRRITKTIY